MRRAAALAVVAALGAPAFGDRESPLVFSWKVDAPVLSLAATWWATGEAVQFTGPWTPPCEPCFAGTLNAIDRGVAGQRNNVADWVSYGTWGAIMAMPIVGDGIDVGRNGGGGRAWGGDMGLFAEALALDGAINQAVKLLARRPRPFVYGLAPGDPAFKSPESFVSYFSEHSSLSFTAAAFYTTLFALRHPGRRGLAAVVGLAAFGLAAVTASLRVVAGKHFPTDVLAGAAIGTVFGAAIPLLHRRRMSLPIALAPLPDGAMILFVK